MWSKLLSNLVFYAQSTIAVILGTQIWFISIIYCLFHQYSYSFISIGAYYSTEESYFPASCDQNC